MKLLKYFILVVSVCLLLISCSRNEENSEKIEITGTIQKQGITTYQYGSHVMAGYAITSSSVNLDDYVNRKVTVIGHKINGYPIDGGPDYIEVEKLK